MHSSRPAFSQDSCKIFLLSGYKIQRNMETKMQSPNLFQPIVAKIESCQNWNCQNWKLPKLPELSKLKISKLLNCQNQKLPKLKVAKIKVAKIESC